MESIRQSMTVLSRDPEIGAHLARNIRNIIGRYLDVYSHSYLMPIPFLNPDLVITSGDFLKEEARRIYPNTPIIVGNLSITGKNIEQLLSYPKGSRAMVFMLNRYSAIGTVESLRQLGLDHLIYEPFWDGKVFNEKNYDLVISPGQLLHSPGKSLPTVDLGKRTFNISTFASILNFFNLEMTFLESYESTYLRQMTAASRRIHNLLVDAEQMSKRQEVILSEIDEGIVALHENDDSIIANSIINKWFGPTSDLLKEGSPFRQVRDALDSKPVLPSDMENSGRTSMTIVKVNDLTLYCRKNVLKFDNRRDYIYTIRPIEQIQKMEQNIRQKLYETGFIANYTFNDLRGDSSDLKKLRSMAIRFAKTDQTILITGESGTGKEVLAQSIHNSSKRAKGPFVAVNFASISENLVESELFGYQEGAFTGAKRGGKSGFFELAHNGTIFLDEIGDAPLHIQAKLLRVLEERQVTRVGGEKNIPINVRVIAATNKSLVQEVIEGRFRQDLYFRLNILPLKTIPLRNMRSMIPAYISEYLSNSFSTNKELHPSLIELLDRYPWPGNFRELKNICEYLGYSSEGKNCIFPEDLPVYISDFLSQNNEDDSDHTNEQLDTETAETLRAFWDIRPNSIGRNQVVSKIQKKLPQYNGGSAKRCFAILKEKGLINSGKTKQGSYITERGIEFWENHMMNNK